jgi:hypothetical protein
LDVKALRLKALPGLLLFAGCSALAPLITQTNTVPWVAATPEPESSPSAEAIPAGTRPCDLSQLTISAAMTGASGTVGGDLTVSLAPTTDRPCLLSGPPASVTIEKADTGQPLTTRYRPFARPSPGEPSGRDAAPVLLEPGTTAATLVIWSNWCGPLDDVRFVVRMTRDPTAPRAITNAIGQLPRCDDGSASSTIEGYAFVVPSHQAVVDVTIDAPGTVASGGTLDYTVTLSNVDSVPLALDPCPAYTEELYRPKDPQPYEERWLLNCNDLPPKLWPGEAATVAMRMAVPADMPLGPMQLAWAFAGGRGESSVEVIAR